MQLILCERSSTGFQPVGQLGILPGCLHKVRVSSASCRRCRCAPEKRNYTRERRRPLPRVYFTGRRLGSIFAGAGPFFLFYVLVAKQRGPLKLEFGEAARLFFSQLAENFGKI